MGRRGEVRFSFRRAVMDSLVSGEDGEEREGPKTEGTEGH